MDLGQRVHRIGGEVLQDLAEYDLAVAAPVFQGQIFHLEWEQLRDPRLDAPATGWSSRSSNRLSPSVHARAAR